MSKTNDPPEIDISDEKKVELRVLAVELGMQIAVAKQKPGHAVYIAADLYQFLLSGVKPTIPGQPTTTKKDK